MFFRCTNDLCGAKYKANKNLHVCPKCRSPVVPGIDFFDSLSQNFEVLEA